MARRSPPRRAPGAPPPPPLASAAEKDDHTAQLAGAVRGDAPPERLARNVTELIERRRAEHAKERLHLRMADRITRFAGSIGFVALHVLWFGAWVAVNTDRVPGVPAFDPFPFSLLTTIVSLEAIFLSAFLLVSQNRMQDLAEQRAELDLHVNLLAEREATELLRKVMRIEGALGIPSDGEDEAAVQELLKETPVVEVAVPPKGGSKPAPQAGGGARGGRDAP